MTPTREAELAKEYRMTALNDIARGGGLKRYNYRHTHVWTAREGWVIADMIDGHYKNHKTEPDLEVAFNIAVRRHHNGLFLVVEGQEEGKLFLVMAKNEEDAQDKTELGTAGIVYALNITTTPTEITELWEHITT